MRYDIGILALIVLYKTKLTESKSFLSLSASLANSDVCMDLLVYDNTPSCNEGGILEHYDNWKIIYHADSENGGVSKAYNKGAQIAKEMNKKWLLLLDQDTSFPLDTMQKYMQAIDENAHEKLLAPILMVNKGTIISPCYFKFMRGFSVKAVEPGLKSLKIFSVINCGLCIDVDAFNLNGGYNEQIKLDFSDHDFIRRFRKSIGNRLIVIDLEVFHSLSSAT
ncbi:MAG: glycosyltransferase, partial [Bacteroidia bacterium]